MMGSCIIQIDDETLTERVYQALDELDTLRVSSSPIYVQVSNGVVTVRGVVATYLNKAHVLQTVLKVPGVHQVRDELWV